MGEVPITKKNLVETYPYWNDKYEKETSELAKVKWREFDVQMWAYLDVASFVGQQWILP